jgi:hypothetical protein
VEGEVDTLTEAEARMILEDAHRVLFYRDARYINQLPCLSPAAHGNHAQACVLRYQIVRIATNGVEIFGFVEVRDCLELCGGYGAQTQ